MRKLDVISHKGLKIEVKLLLIAYRKLYKTYMPHRLAQHRMTLTEVEWPFHASRAISAVAENFVFTARAYARAVLGVVILSVRPSVCHTRAL